MTIVDNNIGEKAVIYFKYLKCDITWETQEKNEKKNSKPMKAKEQWKQY